jgi:uncharacterized protein (DUF2236 family)
VVIGSLLPFGSARLAPSSAVGSALELVESVRGRMANEVTRLLIGDDAPAVERRAVPIEVDPGYFGPGSVTWRLHADSCMLAGGLRALLLQTMHPLAMAGIAEHSTYRTDPLGRLANTSRYVGTAIYGTRPEVRDAVATVKRVHRRVRGTSPDGRPYDANDPHLLTWVHHTLVDSFLRAYARYGSGPLSPADADAYVNEQAVLAELFDAEPAARSVAELRAWFEAERSELRATPAAVSTARFLLVPPLPLVARGPHAVLASAAVTMLPRWVRRDLRLPPVLPTVEPLVVRPAGTVLLRTIDWVLAVPRDGVTDTVAPEAA